MTCLVCRYYQPSEPAAHKQAREAGQCESNCGDRWDQHTAIAYVKNHGVLDGWCGLHPETKPFKCNHVCGDISVREYFFNHHWCVEPFKGEDNLFEWAQKTFNTVLHGADYYGRRRREISELTEKNAELKRQLKRAREVSASRLKRLQKTDESKLKVEHEPQAEPEPQTEMFPHLVEAA